MGFFLTDVFLAIVGLVASVFIVLSIVGIGWFLVWKFFLSRFKFVRELLGTVTSDPKQSDSSGETNQMKTRTRKARID